MKKIILALTAAALCTACGKKAPPPQSVPVPKAQHEEQAAGACVSTAAAVADTVLTAPGNYVRNTVGQVEKARAAKALVEKAARERVKSLDLQEISGN